MLEELARADVSAAILAQLIFNGPPRAIEHLGTDALRDRWLPIAATTGACPASTPKSPSSPGMST